MKKIISCLLITYSFCAFGQSSGETIENILSNNENLQQLHLYSSYLVKKFYQVNSYCLSWIRSEDSSQANSLLDLINSAGEFGLQPADYELEPSINYISKRFVSSYADSIYKDLLLTDLFIHFLSDLKYGNKPLSLKYEGISYKPDYSIIPTLLFEYTSHHQLKVLLEKVEPDIAEYRAMKKIIKQLWEQMHAPGFAEVTIRSNVVALSNKQLVIKLSQLGIVDTFSTLNDKLLEKKLRQAQTLLNVMSDGILRTTSLSELNVSILKRWQDASIAVNIIRRINGWRKQAPLAILNIPSASLFIYYSDTLALYSRAIVGKPSTPTPTLSSSIAQIIVYPYWHVPYKIATKELLPLIRQNPAFLTENNFQVLNKSGKVLDPDSIHWQTLSRSNFPYILRQSTGCDNALGLLKFEFYSPFGVYLHDTPDKGLFFLNKRYFSHGCMRVEEPIAFAQLLLNERMREIDSLIRQCLKDQKPKTLKINDPLNLVVLYSAVWYTEKNSVIFYSDPYKRQL